MDSRRTPRELRARRPCRSRSRTRCPTARKTSSWPKARSICGPARDPPACRGDRRGASDAAPKSARSSRARAPAAAARGVVPGTLSFDVARWNHPRSGDILVSANWTAESRTMRALHRHDDDKRRRRPWIVESVRHPQHVDCRRSGLPRARDERRADGERRHRADAAAPARPAAVPR